MIVDDIVDRILTRIDDNSSSPVSVTQAEALNAVNAGEQLFSWLTLCLETTLPLTIAPATTFGTIRNTFPDFLVPLRIAVGATRLRPSTLTDLDTYDDQWQATAGLPLRYAQLGFNFWAVTPQPAFSVLSQWTYARSPISLALEISQVPEIPDQYHPLLVSYGIYLVKLKQGGQQLQRGMVQFNEFLDGAQEHGDFVRARSRAARYDTLPFELKLFDRARLGGRPRLKRGGPPAPSAQSGDVPGQVAS